MSTAAVAVDDGIRSLELSALDIEDFQAGLLEDAEQSEFSRSHVRGDRLRFLLRSLLRHTQLRRVLEGPLELEEGSVGAEGGFALQILPVLLEPGFRFRETLRDFRHPGTGGGGEGGIPEEFHGKSGSIPNTRSSSSSS